MYKIVNIINLQNDAILLTDKSYKLVKYKYV